MHFRDSAQCVIDQRAGHCASAEEEVPAKGH